jgi:hypothetical protein
MYIQKVISRKNKIKNLFCVRILKVYDENSRIRGYGSISKRHGSADPDPHQNVMDPEHCQEQSIQKQINHLTKNNQSKKDTQST